MGNTDVVALRKESVDRNPTIKAMRGDRKASLSARRAWIEMISGLRPLIASVTVALRKESVDRNTIPEHPRISIDKSLSARRAWIEISVKDLNAHLYYRRSPQGERG